MYEDEDGGGKGKEGPGKGSGNAAPRAAHPILLLLLFLSCYPRITQTFMDNALIEAGAQCSYSTCQLHDFLPIRCQCSHLYCSEHISPEAHACPNLKPAFDPSTSTSINDGDNNDTRKLQRCAVDRCTKLSLESFIADSSATQGRSPAVCPRCQLSFCAS